MKPAAVIASCVVCACAGWWLPALWTKETPRPVRSILPLPDKTRATAAPESLDAAVRRAGSAMAQFHAVAAAVQGRGASLAMTDGAFTGLTCEEAEELAARLAGEEFARTAGDDGPAFLRSLTGMEYHARDTAFATWAEARPAAALRLLLTREATPYLYSTIAEKLIQSHPAEALDILRNTPPAEGTVTMWSRTLNAIAEKNPAAALAALQSTSEQNREPYLCGMLSAMAGKDPQAALQWAAQLPPVLHTANARQAIYDRWSRDDPAAAATHWLVADRTSWISHSDELLRDWAGKDPEAALRWVGEHGLILPESAIGAIAAHDPQRAIQLLAQLDPESRSASLEVQIASRWAAQDFPAALKWVTSLQGESRDPAFAHLAQAVKALPEAEQRAFIAAAGLTDPSGFGVHYQLDPGAALQTFRGLPAEQQQQVWNGLPLRYDGASPPDVAPFLSEMLQHSPNDMDSMTAGVAAKWSQTDPAAAAAWVESLPPGGAHQWAAANLASNWARHDPAAAAAWTHQLPPGPARELAEKSLAGITGGKP